MFTGIITDIGTIVELKQAGDLKARINTSYDVDNIDIGASIACNGVCLTVITKDALKSRIGLMWKYLPNPFQ